MVRSDTAKQVGVYTDSVGPVMGFGFYHLACMLLEIYQGGPRFAIRRVLVGTQDTDVRVSVFQDIATVRASLMHCS